MTRCRTRPFQTHVKSCLIDRHDFAGRTLVKTRELETETKLLIRVRQKPSGKSYQWQEHEESELDRVHIHHQQYSNVANTVTPGPNIGAAPHS